MDDHWNRVRHYRDLAAQAIERAESASGDMERASYYRMAAGWHQLAQEAEKIAEGLDSLNGKAADSVHEGENGIRH